MAELISKFGDALYYSFTNPEPSKIAAATMAIVIGLVLLGVALYAISKTVITKSSKDPRVASYNIKLATANRISYLDNVGVKSQGFANYSGDLSLFGNLINRLADSEKYLVNLCPLTASIGGYIGPLEGVFNPQYYLRAALRAGVRSFVLPISIYYDDNKQPPDWPEARKPAIVCRNSNGTILSLNGMTIKSFCETLLTYKSINASQANEPILVILDGVENHIPDLANQEKDYVQFTSDIAKELKPLDPYRLTTLDTYGSAVGGKKQSEILYQIPLTQLQNKILIFTNFDVDVGNKDFYQNISPKLYDYVNFVYTPVTAATVGTAVSSGARSIHIGDVKGSKVNWTDQARTVWHMTTQDHVTSLPDAQLVSYVTNVGIQCIPIPIFFNDDKSIDTIYKAWGGYAWKVKSQAARFTKPAPIVPQAPSTALNARVDPTLQPGQTSIK